MAIYVTGDTHIPIDIHKLTSGNWKDSQALTKSDYLLILGDFGLVWKNIPDKEEIYWTKWLNNKKFTTLFVCGNHENHPRLQALPEIDMFGSKVGKVSDSIYYLKRGHVYTIQDKSFFCMGGADSYDRNCRTQGVSWWPEEQPSQAEISFALDNFEKYNKTFDYILTHTAPLSIVKILMANAGINIYYEKKDALWEFFEYIYERAKYNTWFCGHWHENILINKCQVLYDEIQKII